MNRHDWLLERFVRRAWRATAFITVVLVLGALAELIR